MSLLLLHKRHTPDDASIWREALARGWRTERIGLGRLDGSLRGHRSIRYYGNVLHASQILDLPLRFLPIDTNFLPRASELGFTKRRAWAKMTDQIEQPFTSPTFVKSTTIKWIQSRVYQPGESLDKGTLDTDWLYLQEVVDFVDEVRCFVLDGKVVTGSYYRKDRQFSPEWCGEDGIEAIHRLVDAIWTSLQLPRGVVLDFGRLSTGEWALIEANEAWASGLYDCDPSRAFDVIVASQVDI